MNNSGLPHFPSNSLVGEAANMSFALCPLLTAEGAPGPHRLSPFQLAPDLPDPRRHGLAGAVMLIIGTATAVAWALTQSGFSNVDPVLDLKRHTQRAK